MIHTAVGPVEPMGRREEDETSGDPIELEADEMSVRVGPLSPGEDPDIFAAVEKMISCAVANGFPEEHVETLRTIVHAYDVWRLELSSDPPASVPPMTVRLREGARPIKCKTRKYLPHVRKFLQGFNSRLVELGLVYENPKSRWSSPVLPVKKSADFMDMRQTTDYRAVNAQTEVMAAVMPILSVVMKNACGMKHFGLFDLLKGFWQLPLDELCQEFMSYMTDEKKFTPCRVLQECSDAAIHFQKTMELCFTSLLYKHLLIWIDGLLLYAPDIEVYLQKLSELFSLVNRVRHDPERIDTLRSLPYPTTAGELQQFVCAANWMREMELTAKEREAFDQVKEALAASSSLDFPDDQATTCLFTDASDVGWAAIVTQVRDFDPKLPVTQQQHRLIQCLSGTFTGSQLNWTVIGKKRYP
ncbi:unnamed protein product [Phytophthora fragariaefolia]|uniref:Unnamed protein product n=1 Tax=Phytophthora fragariaefolia TaxID=1490495 RepID=A0A9W7CX19_9STRA|nr:unnamed protein product [Phytophthora fragariaefolia]